MTVATVFAFAAAVLTQLCGAGSAGETPAAGISEAEFARSCKELHLKNQPWATIPWQVSLTQARQVAAKESKPIFLVVNTGNALCTT
jgi:hypothetical protein